LRKDVPISSSKAHGDQERDCIPQRDSPPATSQEIVMSKSKLAGIVVAGVLMGAGIANAESVFPSSANEVSPTGLVQHLDGTGSAASGAMEPIFPTAAIEHGPAREVSVHARSAGTRPTMATGRSSFPSSAHENGPSL
jgi:hypothetical protein